MSSTGWLGKLAWPLPSPCSASSALPRLQLTMAPFGEVVHMLQELWPGHDTRGGIWCNKVWAGAFREGANLLAHVDANTSQLVLQLHTALEVHIKARASILCLLNVELDLRCLLTPVLDLACPHSDRLSMCSRSSSQVMTPGVASGATKLGQVHLGKAPTSLHMSTQTPAILFWSLARCLASASTQAFSDCVPWIWSWEAC